MALTIVHVPHSLDNGICVAVVVVAIQGYLETAHPEDPTVGPCLGSYGGARGWWQFLMSEVPLSRSDSLRGEGGHGGRVGIDTRVPRELSGSCVYRGTSLNPSSLRTLHQPYSSRDLVIIWGWVFLLHLPLRTTVEAWAQAYCRVLCGGYFL